jgi:hypothetical protein
MCSEAVDHVTVVVARAPANTGTPTLLALRITTQTCLFVGKLAQLFL